MRELTLYLLKSGIGLGAVYLFYRLFLRRMTFYAWNRWYLLIYSILAFLLPLVNVSPVLEKKEWAANTITEWIPSLTALPGTVISPVVEKGWEPLTVLMLLMLAGIAVLAIRFGIQLWSFNRLRREAELIEGEGARFYKVNKPIVPFSFGNSIFVNPGRHDEAELKEIIRHEFVHVKQKHTVDMLWAEWLCILNWYNPFAWLLRKAIRQNLEFIADDKVTKGGVDRKQYQYLLLKVMGQHAYRIGSGFNFSSLKTRIAMMNKIRTHKVHLLKFLFVLPLAALLLITFRSEKALAQVAPVLTPPTPELSVVPADPVLALAPKAKVSPKSAISPAPLPSPVDTVTPPPKRVNDKGYILTVADNEGECVVIVKDKTSKILKAVLLTEWTANEKDYTQKYGQIPPAPPAPKVVIGYPTKKGEGKINPKDTTFILSDVVVVGKPSDKQKGDAPFIKLKSGENAPIYILDDVIIETKVLEVVSPDDIESVSVLKGEKAVEKYGEKGKNGAVEIRLKKKG